MSVSAANRLGAWQGEKSGIACIQWVSQCQEKMNTLTSGVVHDPVGGVA